MRRAFQTPGGLIFCPVGDDDYRATHGGHVITIHKSSDKGFGVSSNSTAAWGITWLRTRKRCAAHADGIVRNIGAPKP